MKTKTIGKSIEKSGAYIILLLPALVLFTTFFIIPFIRSIGLSFTNAYGYRKNISIIGFENYREAITDKVFLSSILVTFKYTLFVVFIGNAFSFILALSLYGFLPGRKIFRTIFFIPNVMSLIIVGYVWTFLYGEVYRTIIEVLGVSDTLTISWLGNPKLAIYSIGITAVWQSVGYAMIIYIAGFQNISSEVLEAAKIDGAGIINLFKKIKLPLMIPVIIMNIIITITICLKAFDFQFAMTSGGPGYATTTMALSIYTEGFKTNRTGYATAQSVILFAFIALTTMLLIKYQNTREEGIY